MTTSFTIHTAPWPPPTSVGVYPAQAWVDPATRPSGPVVTSGVVAADGTVTFTGLAEQARYVAWASGLGVRFGTTPTGLQQPIAVPDRERIKALEDRADAAGSGGGGSGGDTAGFLLVTAAGDPLPSSAGRAADTLWVRMRE